MFTRMVTLKFIDTKCTSHLLYIQRAGSRIQKLFRARSSSGSPLHPQGWLRRRRSVQDAGRQAGTPQPPPPRKHFACARYNTPGLGLLGPKLARHPHFKHGEPALASQTVRTAQDGHRPPDFHPLSSSLSFASSFSWLISRSLLLVSVQSARHAQMGSGVMGRRHLSSNGEVGSQSLQPRENGSRNPFGAAPHVPLPGDGRSH